MLATFSDRSWFLGNETEKPHLVISYHNDTPFLAYHTPMQKKRARGFAAEERADWQQRSGCCGGGETGGEVGSMKKWTQSEKVEWLVSIVLSIVASVATTMLAKWLGVW